MLDGVEKDLKDFPPHRWYDEFLQCLRKNYGALIANGVFSISNPPDIGLIYGDLYHKHGGTRSRLSRITFTFQGGKPKIEVTRSSSKTPVSIGWTDDGQRHLNKFASDAACELASRTAKIRDVHTDELKNILGARAPRTKDVVSIEIDTTGERDWTYIKEQRKIYNKLSKTSDNVKWLSPVYMIGSAALSGIQDGMQLARQMKMLGADCVGDNWNLAIVTMRYGFHIGTTEEMDKLWNYILDNS